MKLSHDLESVFSIAVTTLDALVGLLEIRPWRCCSGTCEGNGCLSFAIGCQVLVVSETNTNSHPY